MALKRPPFYDSLRAFLFVLKKERFFLILGITIVILFAGPLLSTCSSIKSIKPLPAWGMLFTGRSSP